MELKDILSISGYSGLFQYISQGRNGVIVEGLEDKKRMNAYSSYKVSALEDIAIFTDTEEVSLRKILKKIEETESKKQTEIGKADNKKIIAYFSTILPNYDRERVYVSDIKKIINWYNILQRNNLLSILDEPVEETTEIKEEEKA